MIDIEADRFENHGYDHDQLFYMGVIPKSLPSPASLPFLPISSFVLPSKRVFCQDLSFNIL